MNVTVLAIIILAFWIYALQNRISYLEGIVNDLKGRARGMPPVKSNVETTNETEAEKSTLYDEENNVLMTHTKPTLKKVETKKAKSKAPEPQEPSKEASWLVSFITNYFTGGNLLVRIGGVVLFFGLAFLAKYAAEHSTIGIELRLGFIAAVSMVLVAVGWRLRDREGAYGQILQGVGVALLYLLIYAASKFYTLLSLDMAFVLMLVVVIVGSLLAVTQDALPLALFATAGGFFVPILTSGGDGSHIVLFGYYTLLNLSIFTVAWYRSWRLLNIMGFVFTFVIATTWGALRYSPELFASTKPFLVLFFVMYLAVSILFTMKQPFAHKSFVDGTLIFGLPVVAFPLQLRLVNLYEYGAAYSAMALGALYLILAYLLRSRERAALLSQSFLALSVIFFTIAVPYIFDADVSAALWSLESAGIIWISLKQNKMIARYFGEALLLVSVVIYNVSHLGGSITMVDYMGYVIVIASLLVATYLLDRDRERISEFDQIVSKIFLALSICLWFISTPTQLTRFDISLGDAMVVSLVLYALLLVLIEKRLQWSMSVQLLQGYVPSGVLFSVETMLQTTHPFEGIGFFVLGALVALGYFLLYTYGTLWRYAKHLHIMSLWFIVAVCTWELTYRADLLDIGQGSVMIAMAFVLLLFSALLLLPKQYRGWLQRHQGSYQLIGAGGLVLILMFWELRVFGMVPDFSMLPYVPLLNPMDITQVLGLAIAGYWMYRNREALRYDTRVLMYGALALISMVLVTVIFARAVHMFEGVAYTPSALWSSIYFQTGLSILWSIVAIVLMLLSKRYANRPLWMIGFGLLGLVVLKLFFVELSNSGTIERIISFIVVGSLLLVIGYFVPLPPSGEKEGNSQGEES